MESYTSIGDAEQGTYRPPTTLDGAGNTSKSSNTHSEAPVRETAGFWVYIFQILFQVSLLFPLNHLVETEDCSMPSQSFKRTDKVFCCHRLVQALLC